MTAWIQFNAVTDLDVGHGTTGGRFATGWHTLAKSCYQIFLNNYLALAQGKLTKVSLEVFVPCILKSLPIVAKQKKSTGNLKEKFYMHKITKSHLPICQCWKVLVSLKAQLLKHWHFLSFLMKPSYFCTKHCNDLKLQKYKENAHIFLCVFPCKSE